MSTETWLNLPVADLERSRAFFERIGFDVASAGEHPEMLALRVGATRVMLVRREAFAGFAGSPPSDPGAGAEVLLSFSAASPAEIDALAARVEEAGGTLFGRPGGRDGMYGLGFADPDGHRWHALHMEVWTRRDA